MRCRYCDSELPDRALFCGECGRAVATATAPSTAQISHPIVARPLTVAAPPPEPGLAVSTGAIGIAVDACEQCGSSLGPTDIFCGECGFITRGMGTDRHDTAIVASAAAGSEDDFSPSPTKETPAPERFILQFSTGDSLTVSGSGLIGRNPRPEPGEFFDELVKVNDPSRSMSKSHLEFGQEGGEFWIKDRFSGNGTVLRGPNAPVVQLVADRRYRVPRGSRVDVGEQFFVVS